MTIEEIKAGCECGELRKQIAAHKERADLLEVKLDALKTEYDNLMETVDELNDENAKLRGQIKGLKYAIKRLAE